MSTYHDDQFLTRQEAARLLNVGERTLDYHIRKGRLVAIRHGGRVLLDRAEVVALRGSKIIRSTPDEESEATEKEETKIAVKVGEAREVEKRYRDLEDRLQTLECIAGVAGRSRGLNRPYLLSLLQSATYRKFDPASVPEAEVREWLTAISAMDRRTARYCLKNPELRELPLRMLQLGAKLAELAKTKKERGEMLLAIRSLRYLLLSFAPPTPLVKADFPIPDSWSTIDALAVASLAR